MKGSYNVHVAINRRSVIKINNGNKMEFYSLQQATPFGSKPFGSKYYYNLQ